MSDMELAIHTIHPRPKEYNNFQTLFWQAARKNIPRGCMKIYISGLIETNKVLYEEYIQAYKEDPFDENTLEFGENLLASINNEQKECWKEVITNIT